MKLRVLTIAVMFAAGFSGTASAGLLQCEPEPGRLQVRIDGFGRGEGLPQGLEVFAATVHAGADLYEIEPEHVTRASLAHGVLRVEARRMLSAGEAAELVFEGETRASGAEFPARVTFRAEGREMRGIVRCKLI